MLSESWRFAGRIGVLVGASLVAVLIVAYLLSGATYVPGFVQASDYHLSMKFDQVDNLVPGSQVRIAGVRVGEVTSTQPEVDGAFVVFTMRDSRVYPLHQGVTVGLGMKSVQGEYYLDVKDGKGPAIPSGTVLPRSAGRPATRLYDLYKTLNAPVQADTRSLLQNLRTSTAGTQGDVAGTFEGLGALGREGDTALDAVATQDQDLRELSADTATVLNALDTSRGQITDLVRNANQLTGATAGQYRDLARTFQLLPGVLDSARVGSDSLRDLSGALSPVAHDLKDASPGLSDALRQLPGATRDLRGLLPPLSGTLDRAPATLDRTPEFADDVDDLFKPTTKMLRDLNPIVSYLEPYGPDIAAFVANFNSALSYTDRSGVHYIRLGLFQNEETLQSPVAVHANTYRNPFPAPGAGPTPGPFTGKYPHVTREPK